MSMLAWSKARHEYSTSSSSSPTPGGNLGLELPRCHTIPCSVNCSSCGSISHFGILLLAAGAVLGEVATVMCGLRLHDGHPTTPTAITVDVMPRETTVSVNSCFSRNPAIWSRRLPATERLSSVIGLLKDPTHIVMCSQCGVQPDGISAHSSSFALLALSSTTHEYCTLLSSTSSSGFVSAGFTSAPRPDAAGTSSGLKRDK
mmetsp:Transcript_74725/g.139493  ORF Transcript_74725/g.139493 Transcript_74725/m.139493 type:complete len:202 (+) Transcript_74725:1185-1790(+)